jgi:hypothetical protein
VPFPRPSNQHLLIPRDGYPILDILAYLRVVLLPVALQFTTRSEGGWHHASVDNTGMRFEGSPASGVRKSRVWYGERITLLKGTGDGYDEQGKTNKWWQ